MSWPNSNLQSSCDVLIIQSITIQYERSTSPLCGVFLASLLTVLINPENGKYILMVIYLVEDSRLTFLIVASFDATVSLLIDEYHSMYGVKMFSRSCVIEIDFLSTSLWCICANLQEVIYRYKRLELFLISSNRNGTNRIQSVICNLFCLNRVLLCHGIVIPYWSCKVTSVKCNVGSLA